MANERILFMKTYKGFNKNMTAQNGYQYEEGKEYEEEKAVACERGFHACEYPLDCFRYYSPESSVYHVVEQSGEFSKNSDDSKVASTKIKIGAEISIAGLVKAAIEYTKERTEPECDATGNCGASSATGYRGASSATGDYGASSATGDCGASSATGKCGASSATGDYGASSATGYRGASSATGDYGASSATGKCGASSATGYKGSAIAGDPESIAIAWGYKGKAKGVIGSYLVLADWEGNENNFWTQEEWSLKGAKMVRVDGDKIKADTWYTMKNGEILEVEEE
jgi:hypothetical protein